MVMMFLRPTWIVVDKEARAIGDAKGIVGEDSLAQNANVESDEFVQVHLEGRN